MPTVLSDPAKLYREVRAVLAKRGGISVKEVQCKKKLRNTPLLFTDPMCENLAPPFQAIARGRKAGAAISQVETGALSTVLDAYNLVGVRAGFAKLDECSSLPDLDPSIS